MGDNFETANGFDPTNPTDASEDADQDGITNLDEFLAGTNPHDTVLASANEDVPLPLWALLLLGATLAKLGVRSPHPSKR